MDEASQTTLCGLEAKLLLHSIATGPGRTLETFIVAVMIVVTANI